MASPPPEQSGSPPDSIQATRIEILRPDRSAKRGSIIPWRVGAYTGLTLGVSGYAYSKMDDWWGKDTGPFHIKHTDWNGDNLAQTDEVSHCLVSYKIVQTAMGLAKWSGFQDRTSRIIGGCFAGVIMTSVEYPIDAYNPYQGFGYTDMIANSIGIAFALSRDRWPKYLSKFDLRLSIKNTKTIPDEIIAQTTAQNDNYIYWLTVNPVENFPVHAAIGYSGNHNSPDHSVEREVYIGLGTSAAELAGLVDRRWKRKLDVLNIYEISIAFRVD